ncbi:hypothetical protein EC844_12574 [Acinetobacter calcoaceticus]|uniref:Uncharacterized protein n=1 Tax=Acinetobacter calcoaceticus TaxID=471 RepID=A0A4R1XGN2_ACICA|nr:hypothetical protein EC844_12574 [Acinetobacter calcoaceticus]
MSSCLKKAILQALLKREFGKNYTDANGNFYVQAEKVNYRSESLYNAKPREVIFLLEGFERKKVNYLEFPYSPENPSRYEEAVVDIGKVYLNPKN